MQMLSEDVRVVSGDEADTEIFVAARMGTMGYGWPSSIVHNGVTFHFATNEAIPHELAAWYGGYAKYERGVQMPSQPKPVIEEDAPHVQGVTYMRLCETQFLFMRPDRLYYFTVDRKCARCVELAKMYEQ